MSHPESDDNYGKVEELTENKSSKVYIVSGIGILYENILLDNYLLWMFFAKYLISFSFFSSASSTNLQMIIIKIIVNKEATSI